MSLVCKRILSVLAVALLAPLALLAQTVTLSLSSYNFGSTAVGTGTAWFTFTVSNSAEGRRCKWNHGKNHGCGPGPLNAD